MGVTRTRNGAGPTQFVGASGLDAHGGFINADFISDMRGTRKYRNLEEMRLNSPILAAALTAIKYPVRNIGWFYTSAEGDEDPRLELLNEARDNMRTSWGQHVLEALTMLDFGFAPMAIQYRRDGGRILWDRFMLLGQETVMRWTLDEQGDIEALHQWPHIWPTPIPADRLLLYRVNVERNNPEGRSMLRSSWVPYYYVRELQKVEAIGKERGMAGLPVITLAEGATTDEDDSSSDAFKAAKTVRNIRMDEQSGVVLPPGWDIKLLNTGITSEMSMNITIQRHESRMLMTMLVQHLMLGFTQTGTQSKAETDMDLLNLFLNAIADVIAEAHTSQAIPRLMELNGLDAEGLALEHSPPGDTDLLALGDFLQKVTPLGFVTPTPEDESMFREMARLPEMTPEEVAALEDEEPEPMLIPEQMMDEDDMQPASRFAARARVPDNAPDEAARRRMQRQFARTAKQYFSGLEKRVIRGLK